MTILDSELFQKIEIPEVLIWAQEQNEERSPNLTLFTAHFNKLSYWYVEDYFLNTPTDLTIFQGANPNTEATRRQRPRKTRHEVYKDHEALKKDQQF